MELINIVNRNYEIRCLADRLNDYEIRLLADRLNAISARRKKKGGGRVQKMPSVRSKSRPV